jgi:UTP--glucose-1-phosphate uridylyltransferase
VSNSDNLGATLDLKLLGHFVSSDAPFMMEVAQRTESDKKGGHLCRRLSDGAGPGRRCLCLPVVVHVTSFSSLHEVELGARAAPWISTAGGGGVRLHSDPASQV